MQKEEIYLRKVIVHILDNSTGEPILSDQPMEFGSELAEFLKEHIAKIGGGDVCKLCSFYEDQSEVYRMLKAYTDDRFVETSKELAEQLYEIMAANIDIPSADMCVVRFKCEQREYLALLKMNYKEFYTHRTKTFDHGEAHNNELVLHKSILPLKSQRITEAAIIDLEDLSVRLVEKKYEVNGEKTNYFSYLFLKCAARKSQKARIEIMAKAVESVQREAYSEEKQYEELMRARSIISDAFEENREVPIKDIAEQIFETKPDLKDMFMESMEKYDLSTETIHPCDENTLKKYERQCLITDTGIEIKIPMDQYKNRDSVEFVTNSDGTVSVHIKNINHIKVKI